MSWHRPPKSNQAGLPPHRHPIGIDAALDEIHIQNGILYDEDAVAACLRLFKNEGFLFLE